MFEGARTTFRYWFKRVLPEAWRTALGTSNMKGATLTFLSVVIILIALIFLSAYEVLPPDLNILVGDFAAEIRTQVLYLGLSCLAMIAVFVFAVVYVPAKIHKDQERNLSLFTPNDIVVTAFNPSPGDADKASLVFDNNRDDMMWLEARIERMSIDRKPYRTEINSCRFDNTTPAGALQPGKPTFWRFEYYDKDNGKPYLAVNYRKQGKNVDERVFIEPDQILLLEIQIDIRYKDIHLIPRETLNIELRNKGGHLRIKKVSDWNTPTKKLKAHKNKKKRTNQKFFSDKDSIKPLKKTKKTKKKKKRKKKDD